jgi:hypothetical protein
MAVSTRTGAAGAFLLPILLASVGPFGSLAATGIATLAITLLGLALVGSAADRKPTPYEATIARIATTPLFVGVPGSRLETAFRRVSEVPVLAGQAIVSQGEPADRFYVIQSGRFTVSQTPPTGGQPEVLRTLGPDDVFGELGLLYRMPRTATVRADTDALLLALDRDDFLDLVGAGGPLRGRLLGLYAGGAGTR